MLVFTEICLCSSVDMFIINIFNKLIMIIMIYILLYMY